MPRSAIRQRNSAPPPVAPPTRRAGCAAAAHRTSLYADPRGISKSHTAHPPHRRQTRHSRTFRRKVTAFKISTTNCAALSYAGTLQAELRYDTSGRLYYLRDYIGSNGITRFAYDGNAMVAEYNDAATMLRRYVHGSNAEADDPLIWYEGAGAASANARYLYADPRGSIALVASSTGGIIAQNTYDAYGIKGSANAGRFQYTGQAWLPELGMYYYKARIYSPTLGRFLQTDPIGYEDQFNLYAYVGNDSVNGVDPLGLYQCDGSEKQCAAVENFHGALTEAAASDDLTDGQREAITGVLDHLGAPGTGDVVVSFGNLDGANGKVDPDTGNLTLDLGNIARTGRVIRSTLGTNSGRAGVIAGASTLAHEGLHSQQQRGGRDFSNVDERFQSEVTAYWVGERVVNAFGGTRNLRGLSLRRYLSNEAYGSCSSGGGSSYVACDGASLRWNRRITGN